MATLIGNTGSAVIATAETLTSTNTGATVEVNTGTKIIRVPTGVTVSGGNSVGTSGLTVNGNGKAIVIQEGGNIIGGPGNTSNNYGGIGGQGATAMVSNTEIKYIKTSGNIVGGGGGGGGPGRGYQTPTIKTYPTWQAWPGVNSDPVQANFVNSTYYAYYGMRNSQATSIFYDVRDAIADLADSFKKNTFNYNPTINGADGNSGTVFGPGTVGGDGNSGSNLSVNGMPTQGYGPTRSTIANWPATNISNEFEIHYLDQEYTHRHNWYDSEYSRQQYVEYTYYMGIYVTEYFIAGIINWNWTAYNSSNYSGSYWNKSNSMWWSAVNNANVAIDMEFNVHSPDWQELQWNGGLWTTNGGPGGQPGNAYNTTNTTILFA